LVKADGLELKSNVTLTGEISSVAMSATASLITVATKEEIANFDFESGRRLRTSSKRSGIQPSIMSVLATGRMAVLNDELSLSDASAQIIGAAPRIVLPKQDVMDTARAPTIDVIQPFRNSVLVGDCEYWNTDTATPEILN
jgi:hypothetical protein